MFARVLRVDVAPDMIDAVVAAYRDTVRPIHEQALELRQHYVLVDREAGRIELVGVWESAEAVAAIAPVLEPARQRLWARFGADPLLEAYDVADELREPGRRTHRRVDAEG